MRVGPQQQLCAQCSQCSNMGGKRILSNERISVSIEQMLMHIFFMFQYQVLPRAISLISLFSKIGLLKLIWELCFREPLGVITSCRPGIREQSKSCHHIQSIYDARYGAALRYARRYCLLLCSNSLNKVKRRWLLLLLTYVSSRLAPGTMHQV